MRLAGFVRKEMLQVVRDPSSISIAFVLPLILLFLFGYGISLDARHVPIALVIENPTPDAVSFAASFGQSPYFAPHVVHDRHAAEVALRDGEVAGIVVLRADFARRMWDADGAPIQVIVDGTDANTARIITGYVDGAWRVWLTQRGAERDRRGVLCCGRSRCVTSFGPGHDRPAKDPGQSQMTKLQGRHSRRPMGTLSPAPAAI